MTEPTSNLQQATAIMATNNCRGVGEEPQSHGHSPPRPAQLLGRRSRPRRPAGLPVRTEALGDLAVVNFLRGWTDNDGDVPEFVHQHDFYALPPWKLVKGLKRGSWAINKHGKAVTAWFFGGKDGNRRDRIVKGEEGGTWHVEGGPRSIPDGEAYRKRFSYKTRATGKSGKPQGTGWIMMQFSLDKDKEAADQKVISVIYRSNHHKHAAEAEMTSTAASSQDEDTASVDESSFPAGGDGSSPPVPAAAVPMPPVSIPQASNPGGARFSPQDGLIGGGSKITTAAQLLLQAAEKAVHCRDLKEARQIPELEAAKDMHLTTIHQLGLDSSIVSDPFSQLDVHLQYVAMKKKLAPDVRDDIVRLGESMSKKIFSECVNELGKTARQAFNGVERLGANVQEALQRASKMTSLSFVVNESEAKESVQLLLSALLEAGFVSKVEETDNKRPIPVSSTATSGSGNKRKADGVHTEAPPGVRQARTGTCTTNTPEDPSETTDDEIFSGLNGDEITPVGGGGGAHIGFADVPGLEDNLEEPAGVVLVAPQVGDEAEARQQWPEDEMVESPSAPCRIPDSALDPSCRFALKDSACRSDTQQQQQEDGGGAGTEDDQRFECTSEEHFHHVEGGGAFDLTNFSGAGVRTTGLAADAFDLPNGIITFPYFDLDNIEYMPEF